MTSAVFVISVGVCFIEGGDYLQLEPRVFSQEKKQCRPETISGASAGVLGLAQKWVRLAPKCDKSGAFSDQISVHLAQGAQCTEI